jgi:hypothetical protein
MRHIEKRVSGCISGAKGVYEREILQEELRYENSPSCFLGLGAARHALVVSIWSLRFAVGGKAAGFTRVLHLRAEGDAELGRPTGE